MRARSIVVLVVAAAPAVGCLTSSDPQPAVSLAASLPADAATRPSAATGERPLVGDGPVGRRVVGGRWLFRLDGARRWRAVSVPYDWNGADDRENRSGVGRFRRELQLPRGPRRWILRVEGAGHRTVVYLNGRRIGAHTGGYLPFDVPLRGARPGRNRLELRVSSLRGPGDLTHWRRARFNRFGNGGWWNFGGIHREVTIRPVGAIDIPRAQALPDLLPGGEARVELRVLVRNLGAHRTRPALTATIAGRQVALERPSLAGGETRELRGTVTIARPRLWSIGRGRLYRLAVAGNGAAHVSHFGIRTLAKTSDGRALLNGRRLYLRGISLHEDDAKVGSAWGRRQVAEVVRRVDQLGATVVRAHYPLHPALLEAFDRRGVMVWVTAPINVVQNAAWRRPGVLDEAVAVSRETVLRDRGHPSVVAFSIADELAIPVTREQRDFVVRAAAAVRATTPRAFVAIDRVARFGAPDDGDPVWRALDALGVNEYFGWYRGALPPRPPATERDLGRYYDRLHALQPHAALFVTEFGAEAGRHGPATRKGTYAFQTRYLREHLRLARARPYLNGAMVWALRDFRVHMGWNGGDPRPDPPWNQKGVINRHGKPKPAFRMLRRELRR